MKKFWKLQLIAVALVAMVFCAATANAEVKVDASVKPYEKVSGIEGNLNSIGSDTLNNLMTYWAEAFSKIYPNVRIQIEGKGSATAPPALTKGTSQLGPMSRQMKPEEIDNFEKAHGFKPTRFAVALDCLAVYVHKDNPIKGLTYEQLDGIFSKTRKQGGKDIVTWGDLGLTGKWASMPIEIYGRNPASGTYAYFKKHVLKKGDYKDTVNVCAGSADVVNKVATNRAAIGYSGIGYRTSEVRAIPLSASADKPLTEPTFANALDKTYPLGRSLYIYIVKKPGQPAPALVDQFIKFVLSREGQEIVIKDGYGPLPAGAIDKQLKLLK